MYSANAPLHLALNRLRQFLCALYPLKQAALHHASELQTALDPERATQAERLLLFAALRPRFPHWPVAPTQVPELRMALDKALFRNWLKPATILCRTAQSVSNNFLITLYLMDDDFLAAVV